MRFLRDKHALSIVLIVATLTLLPLLAILQYQWVGQVSDSEHERLQMTIRNTTARMCQELNREFLAPASLFMGPGPVEDVAERIQEWRGSSPYRESVKNFYLIDRADSGWELRIFDSGTARFQASAWPVQLTGLRDRLQAATSKPDTGRAPFSILVDETAMAMLTPRLAGPPRMRRGSTMPEPEGFTIIEWDAKAVHERLLPEVVARWISEGAPNDYLVRIASRSKPATVIYTNAPDRDAAFFQPPDALGSFLEMRREQMRNGRGGPPGMRGGRGGKRPPPEEPADDEPVGPPPARPDGKRPAGKDMDAREENGIWVVQVKHRAGSLESVVASARNKNLAISFAILLLLAVSIVLLLVNTQRASRFAALQMEFVAGVSHELRTPLTVICSAGQNLSDGLVADEKQMRTYGTAIYKEGRRLSVMVEQIMSYAGIQSGRAKYDPQPVEVSMVLKHAMQSCEQQIAESGCRVDQRLEADLPLALADPIALAHCVRNLLSNALLYGRDGKWVGISAQRGTEPGPLMVRIQVEDRGAGIDPADVKNIFKPFYRGRGPVAQQIRGAGIGLSLVQRIMEAHGGKASVVSTLGKGSCFTLLIPAVDAPPEMDNEFGADNEPKDSHR